MRTLEERTLQVFNGHVDIKEAKLLKSDAGFEIEANFIIRLPSREALETDKGYCYEKYESVWFTFPNDYPLRPPEIGLRPDFDRNVPHIQPYTDSQGRPVPCISEVPLSEYLLSRGIVGLIEQTSEWLDRHAQGHLIDPKQGWEPMRRDSYDHLACANIYEIRGLITDQEKCCTVQAEIHHAANNAVLGSIINGTRFKENDIVEYAWKKANQDAHGYGYVAPAFIVWPSNKDISESYQHDDIKTLSDLYRFVRAQNIHRSLTDQIDFIKKLYADKTQRGIGSFIVAVCCRRPTNLMNDDSNIEILFYLVRCKGDDNWSNIDTIPVFPMAHIEKINRSLFQRLSFGHSLPTLNKKWALIGCGSLGSKMAVHLARSGLGPFSCFDQGILRTHNLARHALFNWDVFKSKSERLSLLLSELASPCQANNFDFVNLTNKDEAHLLKEFKNIDFLVNTTASVRVRKALSRLPNANFRILEHSILKRGRMACATLEGANRNPNTSDLSAELDHWLMESGQTRILKDDKFTVADIGQGCGSATMIMTDSRLSAYAAVFSEMLQDQMLGKSVDEGSLCLGVREKNGYSISWEQRTILPFTVLPRDTFDGCEVRISSRVVEKIEKDVELYPDIETGGVLMGRFCEANNAFYVVDTVDAPEDSVRRTALFELGVKGLKRTITSYVRKSNDTLYCIGTWHTHLSEQGASPTDRKAAKQLTGVRSTPFILLIRLPSGNFTGLLAD